MDLFDRQVRRLNLLQSLDFSVKHILGKGNSSDFLCCADLKFISVLCNENWTKALKRDEDFGALRSQNKLERKDDLLLERMDIFVSLIVFACQTLKSTDVN